MQRRKECSLRFLCETSPSSAIKSFQHGYQKTLIGNGTLNSPENNS